MFTAEIEAICQPTYNDCILKWHTLGLHGEAIIPANEQEWKKDKAYVMKAYSTVVKRLGLYDA